MNTFNIIKKSAFYFFSLLFVVGCVSDDSFQIPEIKNCKAGIEANHSISQIKELNNTNKPFALSKDVIFSGYVVSNDKAGNFYRTISIQDEIENATAAIQVELDLRSTHLYYPVGSLVNIVGKDLYVAKDNGVYKVGSVYKNKDGEDRVGRMANTMIFDHVIRDCKEPEEIKPLVFSNIAEAKKEENINKLIRLEGVQFKDAGDGAAYYDSENVVGGATNRVIMDKNGNKISLRTSGFTDFKDAVLPEGSGSITIVLSAYSRDNNVTASRYQAYIRDLNDVKLDEPRFGLSNTAQIPYKEEFKNGLPTSWVPYQVEGDRPWQKKTYGGVDFMRNSAFAGSGNPFKKMKSWMVTPEFDFDKQSNEKLVLKVADAYSNGNPLRVYYSTNYKGEGDVTKANWTEIGQTEIGNLNQNSGQYDNNYEATAPIDLSSITGTAHIAIVYDSKNGTVSTTVDVSEISITAE